LSLSDALCDDEDEVLAVLFVDEATGLFVFFFLVCFSGVGVTVTFGVVELTAGVTVLGPMTVLKVLLIPLHQIALE